MDAIQQSRKSLFVLKYAKAYSNKTNKPLHYNLKGEEQIKSEFAGF